MYKEPFSEKALGDKWDREPKRELNVPNHGMHILLLQAILLNFGTAILSSKEVEWW